MTDTNDTSNTEFTPTLTLSPTAAAAAAPLPAEAAPQTVPVKLDLSQLSEAEQKTVQDFS